MKQLSIFMVMFVFLQSCASMFSGTSDRFKLRSDVAGTKFYLDDEELGTDNATTSVSKKKLKSTRFVAKKQGCKDAFVDVETKFDATTLLGLLIDLGLVSILVVDWMATGAVREAERTNYVLNPVCS